MAIRFLSNESIDGSITVGDDVIVSGNITLVNKTTSEVGSILLGSGNALQIYYDGSNSFVSDSGTGDLYVRSNSTLILKSATTKVQAFGSSVDFVTINSTGATFAGIITANSSSSGDYVRLYGSSGTGKWDIYGNGANLRISDNESAGILAVDTGATFGGNVGIGVTPSDWGWVIDQAIEFKNGAFIAGRTDATSALNLGANTFVTATGGNAWKYFADGKASRYFTQTGEHYFQVAGTGTQGGTVTWTSALTIDNSANATFAGNVTLNTNGTNFTHGYSGNGLVLSHHNVGPSNAIVSGNSVYPDNLYINNGGAANDWSNVIISGNVGIGTSTPVSQANYTTLCVNGTNSALIEAQVGTVRIGGIDSSSTALYFGSIGTYPVIFRVAVSEKMRINSQGQTWIGGSSYTGSDIANGNTTYLNSLNAGAFSILHRNGSDAYVHFNTYYNSSSNYIAKYAGVGYMLLANGTANDGFRISKAPSVAAGATQTFSQVMTVGYGASNNVGIGTASPDDKLQIGQGHSILVGDYFQLGSGSSDIMGALGWNRDTTNGVIYNTSFGAFQMHNNQGKLCLQGYNSSGTNQFQHEFYNNGNIYFEGNVGIGTTLPGAKLEVKEGHTILGGTQNNYGANAFTTNLGGYGVESSNGLRYGSYGWLRFNSNNNYTSSARGFAFTNGYKAIEFALLMGTSDQAPPTLGVAGELSNGDLIFHVNNSADFMFGKVAGDGNGPHLQVNSYAYSSTFQGSSTSNILTIKSGTGLSANVGMIIFKDNANDASGQITTNAATNTTSYNTSGSDERLKKNITDWDESVLSKFENLKPKKFNFKTQGDDADKIKGFIAQNEVDKFPEAYPLVEDEVIGEKRYQFNPSGMNVYLMKAIQELKAEIEILKKK
jgi:hypothetical protein